jgi:hypothetical protein
VRNNWHHEAVIQVLQVYGSKPTVLERGEWWQARGWSLAQRMSNKSGNEENYPQKTRDLHIQSCTAAIPEVGDRLPELDSSDKIVSR